MIVHIIDVTYGENDDEEILIYIWGVAERGKSTLIIVKFDIWFYIISDCMIHTYGDILEEVHKITKEEVRCVKEKRRRVYGWKSDSMNPKQPKQFDTLKILFTKVSHRRRANYALQREIKGITICEAYIDPVNQFCDSANFSPGDFINLDDKLITSDLNQYSTISHCDFEMEADACDISICSPDASFFHYRVISFDIECYSHTREFPLPQRVYDACFQIGIVSAQIFIGKDPLVTEEVVLCLGTTPGYKSYTTEEDLLVAFHEYIIKNDPDIIIGYNTQGN